jgi:hypothetical protein
MKLNLIVHRSPFIVCLLSSVLFLLSCQWLGLGNPPVKQVDSVLLPSFGYMRPIDDTLLFVAGDQRIYDLTYSILNTARSDSAQWVVYHSWDLAPQDAVFRNGIGYLVMDNMVHAVDFTNLPDYRLLDNVPAYGVTKRLALYGNQLYVVTEDSFSIVDVSNPARMIVGSRYGYQYDTLEQWHELYFVAADRDRLAVGYGTVSGPKIYLYGVATATAPAPLHVIALRNKAWGEPNWAEFKDDWLIYGNYYGLFALHLEHERQWMIIKDSIDIWNSYHDGSRIPGSPYAGVRNFAIAGPYAACACVEAPHLAFVDVSDPSEMKLATPADSMPATALVDAAAAKGNRVFEAMTNEYGSKQITIYALP